MSKQYIIHNFRAEIQVIESRCDLGWSDNKS